MDRLEMNKHSVMSFHDLMFNHAIRARQSIDMQVMHMLNTTPTLRMARMHSFALFLGWADMVARIREFLTGHRKT